MKKVLFTGGTGFIGRNVIPYLKQKCNIYCPNRFELNLLDEEAVKNYIVKNKIDVIIHCANPNPIKNKLDLKEKMFEDSIRMFLNLYKANEFYEKMYFIGSGAEYDKSIDIVNVSENEEFRSIPCDSYGLAKYTINMIISKSDKACNLRVFGCYGPTDYYTKFITHCINCCIKKTDITIRQDCYFDYMHVNDLGKVLEYFIYNEPQYKSYNVCSGKRILLSEIAKIVKKQMNSNSDIVVLKEGMCNEYTASNDRLTNEIKDIEFIPIEAGIQYQIESEIVGR